MNGGETTTELTLEISVFKDQDYLRPFGVRDFPLKVTLNKPLFIQVSVCFIRWRHFNTRNIYS